MTILIDKKTRQRIVCDPHCGDVMYDPVDCSEPLAKESVPLIGGWKDYTGSGGIPTSQQMKYGALTDKSFGKDSWLEGHREDELHDTGERKGTTRRRFKKKLIKVSI